MGFARRTRRPHLWAAVPNALSFVRVILGAGFAWVPPGPWRVAVVLIAALSDFLDGAASRALRASSSTGRVLDPLADKAFVLGVVGTLLYEGALTPWEVLLLGLREVAVFVGAVWLLGVGDWAGLRRLSPSWLGKLTTAAQFLYIFLVLLERYVHWTLLAATGTLSGLAALHYSWVFLRRRRRAAAGPRATGIVSARPSRH